MFSNPMLSHLLATASRRARNRHTDVTSQNQENITNNTANNNYIVNFEEEMKRIEQVYEQIHQDELIAQNIQQQLSPIQTNQQQQNNTNTNTQENTMENVIPPPRPYVVDQLIGPNANVVNTINDDNNDNDNTIPELDAIDDVDDVDDTTTNTRQNRVLRPDFEQLVSLTNILTQLQEGAGTHSVSPLPFPLVRTMTGTDNNNNDAEYFTQLVVRSLFSTLPRIPRISDFDNMTYDQLLELGNSIGHVKPPKTPATELQISQLPVHVFHIPKSSSSSSSSSSSNSSDDSKHEHEHEHENTSCRICLVEFAEGDMVRTLPCFHQFHQDEIDKWLISNEECPLCKHPVSQIEPDTSF